MLIAGLAASRPFELLEWAATIPGLPVAGRPAAAPSVAEQPAAVPSMAGLLAAASSVAIRPAAAPFE